MRTQIRKIRFLIKFMWIVIKINRWTLDELIIISSQILKAMT